MTVLQAFATHSVVVVTDQMLWPGQQATGSCILLSANLTCWPCFQVVAFLAMVAVNVTSVSQASTLLEAVLRFLARHASPVASTLHPLRVPSPLSTASARLDLVLTSMMTVTVLCALWAPSTQASVLTLPHPSPSLPLTKRAICVPEHPPALSAVQLISEAASPHSKLVPSPLLTACAIPATVASAAPSVPR